MERVIHTMDVRVSGGQVERMSWGPLTFKVKEMRGIREGDLKRCPASQAEGRSEKCICLI